MLAAGGFQYTAGALAEGAPDPADPEPVTRFEPRGRVGTRVPHRWLDPARTRSTIDVAGPHWAVLGRGDRAAEAAAEPGMGAYRADEADFLRPGELVLLRPDHVIAWRGTDPGGAMRARQAILTR